MYKENFIIGLLLVFATPLAHAVTDPKISSESGNRDTWSYHYKGMAYSVTVHTKLPSWGESYVKDELKQDLKRATDVARSLLPDSLRSGKRTLQISLMPSRSHEDQERGGSYFDNSIHVYLPLDGIAAKEGGKTPTEPTVPLKRVLFHELGHHFFEDALGRLSALAYYQHWLRRKLVSMGIAGDLFRELSDGGQLMQAFWRAERPYAEFVADLFAVAGLREPLGGPLRDFSAATTSIEEFASPKGLLPRGMAFEYDYDPYQVLELARGRLWQAYLKNGLYDDQVLAKVLSSSFRSAASELERIYAAVRERGAERGIPQPQDLNTAFWARILAEMKAPLTPILDGGRKIGACDVLLTPKSDAAMSLGFRWW